MATSMHSCVLQSTPQWIFHSEYIYIIIVTCIVCILRITISQFIKRSVKIQEITGAVDVFNLCSYPVCHEKTEKFLKL